MILIYTVLIRSDANYNITHYLHELIYLPWNLLSIKKKEKNCTSCNRQGRLYSIEKTDWIQFCWNKRQGTFQCWSELIEKYWRTFLRRLVHVVTSSVFTNWCLLKLASYPPTETGKSGLYLSWWLHFKEMAPRSLRRKKKNLLGCKTGKRLREDLYLKGVEK